MLHLYHKEGQPLQTETEEHTVGVHFSIPLPGPFAWSPGWPKTERSGGTGVVGFILVVLPVWLVFASLWCIYAVLWLMVWVIIALVRAIAHLLSPRRSESIDEPAAYDNHLTHDGPERPARWSNRR